MRRLALTLLSATALTVAVATPTAPAASPPLLSLSSSTVRLDHSVTVRGREWPVIEFCKRRVRLRLESDQNAVLIGFTRIRDNGRFTRNFTPRTGRIGPGPWRVVARLRCESGDDGSANFITRKRKLRIRR
jgi:hypothetical protein